jgi:hypothetical protein
MKNKKSKTSKKIAKTTHKKTETEEAPKIRKIVLSDNRLNLAEVPEKRKRGRPRGTFASQEGSASSQQSEFQQPT